MGCPKDSSSKVADWSSREGLDWTGRGRAAGVSNEGVADNQLRIGYRPAYQNNCFGMIATLVRHSWGPVGAILMHGGAQKRVSPHACNLLADLDGDPARRNVCRVGRLAEHSRSARGASWLAARRPRGDGKARLVMQPVVRPFGIALPALDLPPAASVPGRGRTMSDRRRSL